MKQSTSLPEIKFDSLSLSELQLMEEGANLVNEAQRSLTKGGVNVVGECLKGQGTFFEMEHYPNGDVFDAESFSQYYYHTHRENKDEHGHFHTFMRASGISQEIQPVQYSGDVVWPSGEDAVSHIISISMNRPGFPISLFATNRWVTGETWYHWEDVVSMLENWSIDHAFPNQAVNHWISGMVKLFRPQIVALLQHRDKVIEDWKIEHPDKDVFEDRRLEVTGEYDISVEQQHSATLKALAQQN